jgi:hypothetical protein
MPGPTPTPVVRACNRTSGSREVAPGSLCNAVMIVPTPIGNPSHPEIVPHGSLPVRGFERRS